MNLLSDMLPRPDFDMHGVHLVCASAGTGKTYSIQSLYLRLILLQRLTVQQILVVTFTEAATKELRDRLRRVLLDASRCLEGSAAAPPEARTVALVGLVPDGERDAARHAVRIALLDFDLAAIHTIHGFCLRALARFAFETGQDFEATPGTAGGAEIERLCEDWWRLHMYRADRNLAAIATEAGVTLKALKSLARKRIAKPDAVLRPQGFALTDVLERLRTCLRPALDARPEGLYPAAPEGLAEEGLRAWTLVHAALARARAAAASGDWIEAVEQLRCVRDVNAKGPPWTLPPETTALIAACAAFGETVAAAKAKDFSFNAGRLEHKKLPSASLAIPDDAIRRLGAVAFTVLADRLAQAPAVYPLRRLKAAQAALDGMATLAAYSRGDAGVEGGSVVEAIRAVAKGGALLPDAQVISLRTVAPQCAEATEAAVGDLRGLLSSAAEDVATEYRRSRSVRTSSSFDDYLLDLREALTDSRGPALCAALRGDYRAALIDEFQDTDPVQYAIFGTLFGNGDRSAPCFLVGDPKQAIYRFRNGDIETYRAATRAIGEDCRHALNRNFRSEANLITAVNQLFGDRPRGAHAHTFRLPEMAYDGSLEAQGKADDESLTVRGAVDPCPFKLWYFEGTGNPKRIPGLDSPLARAVYAQTAEEIRALLADPETRIGGAEVRPRHIAVLVMRHAEASAIEAELVARGVPVVRQGTRNVFDTPEAQELWTLLHAMAEPRDLRRVRAAMASRSLGVPYDDILALNEGALRPLPSHWQNDELAARAFGTDPSAGCGLEHWASLFETLHRSWQRNGFAAAFELFARLSGVRARLAGAPRGERSLTNMLQLAELLHRAIAEERLSVEGTLARFQRNLDADRRMEDEAQELRLDTDADAVRILTVFKSKGLEFPIVFVPTLFLRGAQAKRATANELEYHNEVGQLVIETGTADGEPAALRESFEEDLRLAYVATTRAVHRTVLVWAQLDVSDERHALAWLLGSGHPQESLRSRFGDALAMSVETRSMGAPRAEEAQASPVVDRRVLPPTLSLPVQPTVEKRFGHGSFSALAPHSDAASASDGARANVADHDLDTTGALPPESLPAATDPLFTFPAGATTGTCWHKVFETLPFDAGDAQVRSTVEEQLDVFGLLSHVSPVERASRISATFDMVRRVLATPLPSTVAGQAPFRLQGIALRDRKDEWDFSFPSARWPTGAPLRTTALTAALRNAWSGDPRHSQFLASVESWDRALPGGFLTGFIDLLFRHDGRYYVLDWKSNRRGGVASDFEADGLRQEMAQHAYFLQYLFYTVAVHQYLRGALPGYDYDRHFGGTYYVFLRGVDGTTPRGIYADRPTRALVEDLSAILGNFVQEGARGQA